MFALKRKVTAALALVFALGTGTSSFADNLSVRYGQGACSYVTDTSTGRSMEFYGDVDSRTEAAQIGFRYVIEFQKPVINNNCHDIERITTQRMQLDLEQQRLELELLRAQIENERNASNVTPVSNSLDSQW
jgi:hypothetical protein